MDGDMAAQSHKFLGPTEGFECLIREAATHDSSPPLVVEA